jgi:hypothetical protein
MTAEEAAPRPCAHPDCDGWRMHNVTVHATAHGTYVPVCSQGCQISGIGSYGCAKTAQHVGTTNHTGPLFERCDGRCANWS